MSADATGALAEHEVNLRALWRELAEKNIDLGTDWPFIARQLFRDIDDLAARVEQARAGEGALRERIEREHREEWASYIENWDGAVGPEPPTVASIIAALRRPTPPFGVSAALTEGDPT